MSPRRPPVMEAPAAPGEYPPHGEEPDRLAAGKESSALRLGQRNVRRLVEAQRLTFDAGSLKDGVG